MLPIIVIKTTRGDNHVVGWQVLHIFQEIRVFYHVGIHLVLRVLPLYYHMFICGSLATYFWVQIWQYISCMGWGFWTKASQSSEETLPQVFVVSDVTMYGESLVKLILIFLLQETFSLYNSALWLKVYQKGDSLLMLQKINVCSFCYYKCHHNSSHCSLYTSPSWILGYRAEFYYLGRNIFMSLVGLWLF